MSFQIKHGIFKLDITDHHAVLGLPLNANPKEIRIRALKIVQQLHPDTCKAKTQDEKERANQLLSRLVNPAYHELSQDKNRAEHLLLLSQMGKRLAAEERKITLVSEQAKKLYQANDNLDALYYQLINSLGKEQYQNLDSVLIKIAQLSELNLIYLVLKQGKEKELGLQVKKQELVKVKPQVTKTVTTATAETQKQTAEPQKKESPIQAYIRRAQDYLEKNKFNEAILELRDAIKLDPKNSTTQALMAKVYVKQKQSSMAKVYLQQALESNPKDPLVMEVKQELDKLTGEDSSKGNKKEKNTNKFLQILFKKL